MCEGLYSLVENIGIEPVTSCLQGPGYNPTDIMFLLFFFQRRFMRKRFSI